MANIHMFHDLPPIALEHPNEYHNPTLTDRSVLEWHNADPYAARALVAFGMGTSLQSCKRPDDPYSLRAVPGHSITSETMVWRPSSSRTSSNFHTSGSQHPWDTYVPLPQAFVMPGHVSPSPSSSGDRSSSEHDSCSTWSAEPSECRPESFFEDARVCSDYATEYDPRTHGQSLDYPPQLGYSPSSSEASSLGSPRSTSGIALRDVQQYPDTYPGDSFDKTTRQKTESEIPYYLGHPSAPQMSRSVECKEPTPDLTSSTMDCEESIAPQAGRGDLTVETNHTRDEANDSGSDYSPKPRRPRTHNRCSSRNVVTSSSTKSPTSHLNKQNGEGTQRSKPNRVTKASPKRRSSIQPPAITTLIRNEPTTCPHCHLTTSTQSALSKHIATVHTRPFICTFFDYGCPSTFGSKNEWKRHVSSQHLRLGIWRCDLGACVPQSQNTINSSQSPKSLSKAAQESDDRDAIYNDFNRKDLFTQHLRRMHAPPKSRSEADKDAFNVSIEAASRRCLIDIRDAPQLAVCGYCNEDEVPEAVFQGPTAWEQRMEHVGRHLENGHAESRTWREDVELRDWMIDENLLEKIYDGSWKLVGLKGEESKVKKSRKKSLVG